MNKIEFFIDTGDEEYIKKTWKFLLPKLHGREIVGITTNPNAMSKCNVKTISEFEIKVRNLCKIISGIRQDDQGVVYVQHPDSNIPPSDLEKWIATILTFSDGQTKVGIKIPPYFPLLNLIEKYKSIIDFNVTGVADCSTASLCFTYSPRYVSLIPGRMEESGINAIEQMRYIHQRKSVLKSELITGSMRTIEGLKSAVYCHTIPTIGVRIFDLFFNHPQSDFLDIWNFKDTTEYLKFSPLVDSRMTGLSIAFFEQMDSMGTELNKNLQ